jgi:hypothetical protein
MVPPAQTGGLSDGPRMTVLRAAPGGVMDQAGDPQPVAVTGAAMRRVAAALAPGRSTTRETLTVQAAVVVAYLTGIVPGAGRGPSMLTFGQPSSVHEMAPMLRNTITATVPGIVTAGDCGPLIRKSCPEQRATT